MPRLIACLTIAGILVWPASARSQATSPTTAPREPSLRTLLVDLAGDVRRLPSQASGISIATGSILSTSLYPVEHDLRDWEPAAQFESGTWIGNPLVLAGGSLALYGAGRWTDQRRVRWIAADLLRAQLLSLGISYSVKYAVGRQRPDESSEDSFPSGHSAQMFASATVLARHLGARAAWPAFGAAGFVALSRLNQHRHHVSDVIFGAGVGVAVGWNATRAASAWRMSPTMSRAQLSLSVSRVF